MERLTIRVLQRRMVLFSVLALLLTGAVVATVAIVPLSGRLTEAAKDKLVHVHVLTAQMLDEHARSLEDLALQITSRTRIREEMEAYRRGERTAEELRRFTEPKLADAMHLSPLMIGITRQTWDTTTGDVEPGNVMTVAAIGHPPPIPLRIPLPGSIDGPLLLGPIFEDGLTLIVVVAPIRNHDGVPVGRDIVTFSGEGLGPILRRAGLHICYLGRVDGDKVLWFGVTPDGLLTPATAPVPLLSAPEMSISSQPGANGKTWVTIAGPQGRQGWQLVTIAPAEHVYAEVRTVVALAAVATTAAVLLGALFLLLLLRPLGGTLLVQADDMAFQLDRLRDLGKDLEAQRRRLSESNKDLEQFAYAASHDLQQPLRMISGFLDLLRRRYTDRLDDTAREYIEHAVNGARQLRDMIQGLLEYSRVGRLEETHRVIDLGQSARQALELLSLPIEETAATVDLGPLPTLDVEPQQMIRLFQNLIDNALKYRHPDRPPKVAIAADAYERGWRIRVADNGLGMDPSQQRDAFGLFKRLHPDVTAEGTGLGLALCQKIVHRHGGTIKLESTVGEGTTFTIWLPNQPPEPPPDAP